MKKVLALVLAVVLCMGLGAVAFAATADSASNIPDIVVYVQVEKAAAANGNPATYFEADDLKASIDWDDGKAQLDKIKLSDEKGFEAGGSAAKEEVPCTFDHTSDSTCTTGGACTPDAKGICAKGHTAHNDACGYKAAEAAVPATAVPGVIKVKISFKDYYGTDEVEIGGTLSLKKGSVSKNFKVVDTTDGSLSAASKEYAFTNNFEWDELGAQTDKDDDTVVVDIDTGAVIFNDDEARFTTFEFANADALSVAGKMSKQDKVNMYLDTAVNDEIKALMKKNEDVDFDVLNFVGKPEFDFTQEVTWYLEDEDKEYFVYEVKDGKATKVNAKLNDDKDALVWKARVLGAYIVTDAELKAVVGDEETGDKTETGDKENPETGASDFVGVAVALGAVSLVAAGAVSLKK